MKFVKIPGKPMILLNLSHVLTINVWEDAEGTHIEYFMTYGEVITQKVPSVEDAKWILWKSGVDWFEYEEVGAK